MCFTGSIGYADFSQSVERYNSSHQGSAAGSYTIRSGDSLPAIAAALYGDANLWYKIAEANGLSAGAALIEGQHLLLPAGVTRSGHSAATARAYDASDALGDTLPTTPKPPKNNKCAIVGQVLLAAVAIAVSAILPGGGTVLGAAVNGALGSAASQGVGVATGIQDRLSLKGAALSALAAGVGVGISNLGKAASNALKISAKAGTEASVGGLTRALAGLGSGTMGARVAASMLGSTVSQGIATLSKLQAKFSFAGVAAAGVAAGVGRALGGGIETSGASLLASAATRSAIEGTSFTRNIAAGLPDVIAQTIVDVGMGMVRGGELGGISHTQSLREAKAKRVERDQEAAQLLARHKLKLHSARASAASAFAEGEGGKIDDAKIIGSDLGRDIIVEGARLRKEELGDKQPITVGQRLLSGLGIRNSGDYTTVDPFGIRRRRALERDRTPVAQRDTFNNWVARHSPNALLWRSGTEMLRAAGLNEVANRADLEGDIIVARNRGANRSIANSIEGTATLAAAGAGDQVAQRQLAQGLDAVARDYGQWRSEHAGRVASTLSPGTAPIAYLADRFFRGVELDRLEIERIERTEGEHAARIARNEIGAERITDVVQTVAPFGAASRAGRLGRISRVSAAESAAPVMRGIAFENAGVKAAQAEAFLPGQSVRRLSVRAFDDAGNLLPGRTVLDTAGYRSLDDLGALEFKLHEGVSLTARQSQHFPYLARNGGVVVGNNGRDLGLRAGSPIGPLDVQRINGPTLPLTWWPK